MGRIGKKWLVVIIFMVLAVAGAGFFWPTADYQIVGKKMAGNPDGSFTCAIVLSNHKEERIYCSRFDYYYIGDYVRR